MKVLLAHEMGAVGVVVVNNRVSIGSVVKMNLGELTHRIHFKKSSIYSKVKSLINSQVSKEFQKSVKLVLYNQGY